MLNMKYNLKNNTKIYENTFKIFHFLSTVHIFLLTVIMYYLFYFQRWKWPVIAGSLAVVLLSVGVAYFRYRQH